MWNTSADTCPPQTLQFVLDIRYKTWNLRQKKKIRLNARVVSMTVANATTKKNCVKEYHSAMQGNVVLADGQRN